MNYIYSTILFCFLVGSEHHYPSYWDELHNNNGWELIQKTSRVNIFSKNISISSLPIYKVEMISELDMEYLLLAAWDIEKSKEAFPNAYIIDSGIYTYNSNKSYTAYQVFDIPFMSPRLYQFHSILLNNSIHWNRTTNLNNNLNPNNYILPPLNFGSWTVEKKQDKTKLTYRLCTDPGGNVPIWIIELANQKYLPHMVLDLEKFAKKNK